MFREIMTFGAFNLGLELITQLEEDSANMTIERNRAQRQPYRDALKGVIALAEERMQLGETNVKGLLFLSMGLGQIDAMEQGAVPEEAIFAAAKQSATRGYEILASRWKSNSTSSYAGVKSPQGQDGELTSNGAAIGSVVDPLPAINVDFNFDEWSSWLFPSLDEIPWASMEDFQPDFHL